MKKGGKKAVYPFGIMNLTFAGIIILTAAVLLSGIIAGIINSNNIYKILSFFLAVILIIGLVFLFFKKVVFYDDRIKIPKDSFLPWEAALETEIHYKDILSAELLPDSNPECALNENGERVSTLLFRCKSGKMLRLRTHGFAHRQIAFIINETNKRAKLFLNNADDTNLVQGISKNCE